MITSINLFQTNILAHMFNIAMVRRPSSSSLSVVRELSNIIAFETAGLIDAKFHVLWRNKIHIINMAAMPIA